MLINQTIKDALIEIGVINAQDETSPQESEHALRTLNRIVSLYNQQGLLIPFTKEIVIANEPANKWGRRDVLIGRRCSDNDYNPQDVLECMEYGVGQYSEIYSDQYINVYADVYLDMVPTTIEKAFFRDSSGIDYNMVEDTMDNIRNVSNKFITGYPSKYCYQKDSNNSMQIIFNCIPSSDLELHLLVKMPYKYEYSPMNNIICEYGFEKMLMLRLAVELCPSYGIEPSQTLIAKLQEAENIIKASNYKARTIKSTFGRKRGGWHSNLYRYR